MTSLRDHHPKSGEFEITPRLSAVRCMLMLAKHHRVCITSGEIAAANDENTIKMMMRLISETELRGRLLTNKRWLEIISLGSAYPALAQLNDECWVYVSGIRRQENGSVLLAVLDPRSDNEEAVLVDRAEFESLWNGRLLLCKRIFRVLDTKNYYGLGWFVSVILPHSHYLRDMALLSFALTGITFATPLLFQTMIDTVIPHHSYNTLWSLAVIFAVLAFAEGLLTYTRETLTMFLSNKTDAQLASKTYEYMLGLTLPFFENMPAGILTRNLTQTETVRNFLTGPLFHTVLNLISMPVLLVGLAMYSLKLTLVVLAFSAVIAVIIGLLIPLFARQIDILYQAEGDRMADVMETIHNVRAVKSLALEKVRQKQWNRKVNTAIKARISVFYVSAPAVAGITILQKLMTIAILCLGVSEIFNGSFTVGGMVAFFMLSGNVSGPLVQLAGLINEYQQVALSVRMLGTVMEQSPERNPNQHGIHPPIGGKVEFEEVQFSYRNAVRPALDNISFRVDEGEMLGIVGRSGSGKTTVTRLIQGINLPDGGMIRLSDTDIRHIDLSYLRRNVGVVLQENLLFRGSIRENISVSKPDATLEEIREAARLAGAEEFIDLLPHSYDTFVEESATNFSGGQRQRIAIARALLAQPRLLIFDEATSALDPDSEAIIQDNLADISRGRTMIVVSHRLSSLVTADKILVLEQGQAMDIATHPVLLERCAIYKHLWHQQNRHIM